jgi:hypothetical protein
MLREEKSPKFNFKEIVRIVSQREPVKQPVIGLVGYVSGRAQDENGLWSYTIFLYDLEECWSFDEEMLKTTANFDASLLENKFIRVRMNGRHARVVNSDE